MMASVCSVSRKSCPDRSMQNGFIEEFHSLEIPAKLWTLVTKIRKSDQDFQVWTVSRNGGNAGIQNVDFGYRLP